MKHTTILLTCTATREIINARGKAFNRAIKFERFNFLREIVDVLCRALHAERVRLMLFGLKSRELHERFTRDLPHPFEIRQMSIREHFSLILTYPPTRSQLVDAMIVVGKFTWHIPRGQRQMSRHAEVESSYHAQRYRVIHEKLEHHHAFLIVGSCDSSHTLLETITKFTQHRDFCA